MLNNIKHFVRRALSHFKINKKNLLNNKNIQITRKLLFGQTYTQLHVPYECNCVISTSPTSNCQVATISNIQGAIKQDILKEVLIEAFKTTRKLLYILDIKNNSIYIKELEKYGEFKVKEKYTNTNFSNMKLILYQIDFEKLGI